MLYAVVLHGDVINISDSMDVAEVYLRTEGVQNGAVELNTPSFEVALKLLRELGYCVPHYVDRITKEESVGICTVIKLQLPIVKPTSQYLVTKPEEELVWNLSTQFGYVLKVSCRSCIGIQDRIDELINFLNDELPNYEGYGFSDSEYLEVLHTILEQRLGGESHDVPS